MPPHLLRGNALYIVHCRVEWASPWSYLHCASTHLCPILCDKGVMHDGHATCARLSLLPLDLWKNWKSFNIYQVSITLLENKALHRPQTLNRNSYLDFIWQERWIMLLSMSDMFVLFVGNLGGRGWGALKVAHNILLCGCKRMLILDESLACEMYTLDGNYCT